MNDNIPTQENLLATSNEHAHVSDTIALSGDGSNYIYTVLTFTCTTTQSRNVSRKYYSKRDSLLWWPIMSVQMQITLSKKELSNIYY